MSRPPSLASLPRDLIQRRVPHILAIYAGASWGLVEFTAFAVDEFLLSPYWTRAVLITLFMMAPSVLMVAWFHGKPGKDRDSLPRTEKIGIPANLVLCVIVLSTLFGREEPGSATTSVTVETEDGETIEREVLRTELRKTTVLFPLDPGPGIAESASWISYAVPEALTLDLMADDFFAPVLSFGYESYVIERGFESFTAAPLALKRELARELYAGFMAVGEIDRVDDLYRVTVRVYRVGNGSLAGETFHEGTDLLALVDEMSEPVKRALEIPAREAVEDLPVRGRLSEDAAAVEAYFKGVFSHFAHRNAEVAIEHLSTAIALDPSFAVAQYTLFRVFREAGQGEATAMATLTAAMENLYRMPERQGFQVKAEYYRLIGETDRAATVVDMWVELYPNDLNALRVQVETRFSQGDWEGALPTLATIRRLDPLDGGHILLMALAQERLGNHDQTLSLLTEYVERFPGDAFAYSRLADFQRRRGRYDEARESLERAIVLEPLAPEFARELAQLDLDTGRLDEARDGFERSLALARTPAQRTTALGGLTRYHHRRGEMTDAIGAIETRRKEEASFLDQARIAQGSLGDIFVYLDAGRVDDAINVLRGLQEAYQGPAPYLQRLAGHIALATEGVDAARVAHRQAWESVEAEGSAGFRPTLLGDLGLIRDRAGDYAGAVESFREAIALSPEGRFHLGAGRALRRAGRLDEAEVELRSALRLVPADPHAHLEMGLLMQAGGDTIAAVGHLRDALAVWENADEEFEPARQARAMLAELTAHHQARRGAGGARP